MLRSRPCTPVVSESKDPRVLAINHTEIDCLSADATKAIPHKFTVLKPLVAGFGAAPFVMAKKDKRDPNARKYSEVVYGDKMVLRMWPYEKVSVLGDKGQRVERPFEIQCGNVLTLFVDNNDRLKKASPFPPNLAIIPMFSVCEITLAPKSTEAEARGSSVKITSVRPVSYTMHSLFSVLPQFALNLSEARVRQNDCAVAFPNIQRDLDTKDVAFAVRVKPSTVVTIYGSDLKLSAWGGDLPIILPGAVAQKYTNLTSLQWTQGLLNCAIVCDSLWVLVFSHEFWSKDGSIFKGIPLIDTEHMLAGAEPGSTVETRYTATMDDVTYKVAITVGGTPHHVETGQPLMAQDFVLAGLETSLSQAYDLTVDFVGEDASIPSVWRGYINASRDDTIQHNKRFYSMMN